MNNPFNPSFGKMPSIFLDRSSLAERIISELDNLNSPYQTSLIYGQRGSGKTTLMTDISAKLKHKPDWIVLNLVLDDDLLISLIDQLQAHVRQIPQLADFKLDIFGLGMGASFKKQVNSSFQVIFEELLKQLTRHKKKILINIDEVHLTPSLKKFAGIYQIMIRENLNVALLMAGLPENVSEIQNDDVLTFLLRAKRIVLNPLNIEDIKNSYYHIFANSHFIIKQPALLFMTKQTNGFAYAFQLLGYYVWQKAQQQSSKEITLTTIKSVLDSYISDLNRNVYFKIYQGMSEKEQEFVQAMVKSKHNKVKTQKIGQIMSKPANYIAVYRRKLIDDQIIKASSYGYVSFLLPYFDKFVEQEMILQDFSN